MASLTMSSKPCLPTPLQGPYDFLELKKKTQATASSVREILCSNFSSYKEPPITKNLESDWWSIGKVQKREFGSG